jgi:uncharacterized protein (TIGR03790 family)
MLEGMVNAILVIVFVCTCLPWTAAAQSGANVLVVANSPVPASEEIALYYAEKRGVPADQVLTIHAATTEEVTRTDFQRTIEGPILAWLQSHSAQDRILYIVLAKGVPLRIAGTGGRSGTASSVDSELTLLYRTATGQFVSSAGPVANPYFAADAVASPAPFSHRDRDIYMVTRLDGFTVADVKGLVDRGVSPVRTGAVVLDQRATLKEAPNQWLATAAERIEAAAPAAKVVLEKTSRPAEADGPVLAYSSWGSNDPGLEGRQPGFVFAPGALAILFVSSDARTFNEPPPTWHPGPSSEGGAFFGGSNQSLAGDLVRAGASGMASYVAEPYLDGMARPDLVFPSYFAGLNLAEAFYAGLPSLGWQSIVVGDPLCAPFRGTMVPAATLDPPIDPDTELPAYFSARRLASASAQNKGANPQALNLFLRAEARNAYRDREGAVAALEAALQIDDSLTNALRILGDLYDQANQYDKAMAAYRKLVARSPNDVFALNNLAYAIATQQGQPSEGLPFAERAHLLAPRNGVVADTLAWIKHLLGNDTDASRLLAISVGEAGGNADVRWHAAVIYASGGRLQDAARELDEAERLDPAVKQRADYAEVAKKVRGAFRR